MEPNLIYLVGVLILILIGVIVTVIKLNRRIQQLLQGKNAQSLEDTLLHLSDEIKRMNQVEESMGVAMKDLHKRLKTSITGVGVVRFNPFAHSGGNQSFAIAFLNEHGDGVIISTLYGRERTSIFAKPIKKYKSEFELTTEEQKAIEEARK